MSDRPAYCPRCGTEAPASGNYCAECGADLIAEATGATDGTVTTTYDQCPRCQAGIPDGDETCPSCGTDVTREVEIDAEDDGGREIGGLLSTRQFLATLGGLSLLGAGGFVATGGLDGLSGPQYPTDVFSSRLTPELEVFPEGWQRRDEFNDNFDAVFLNEDRTILVMFDFELYETVSAAERGYQNAKSGFANARDYDLGDAAFWAVQNERSARTYVRDSNLLGLCYAARESNLEMIPDQSRSQLYAGEMVNHWQDTFG